MLFALNEKAGRIEPSPGKRAICPICKREVIAKCGEIITWHWSHLNLSECDSWSEPNNEWHYTWKKRFPAKRCEVLIENRVADIVTANNEVIKLQKSYISPYDIKKRENFFKNMIWVFNVSDSINNIEFKRDFQKADGYATFRWKYPKKHVAYTSKPTILDTGEELFILKKMYKSTPCGGYGNFISIKELLMTKRFNGNYLFKKSIDPKTYWEGRE